MRAHEWSCCAEIWRVAITVCGREIYLDAVMDDFGNLVAIRNRFRAVTQRQRAAPQPLRAIRLREVISKTGLSRATLHNLEVAGRFPQHRLLTPRCAVWIGSEVDQWLLERLASPAAYAPLPNVELRRSTPGRGKNR